MSSANPSLIGRIVQINAAEFIVSLPADDDHSYSPYVQFGLEEVAVAQVGSHVLIKSNRSQILAQVVRTWQEGEKVKAAVMPLGEISREGRFSRGIQQYPVLQAEVHLVGASQLDVIFESLRREGLNLGRQSQRQEIKVFVDPNNLFSRHLAILGQSGSGKSWTVTSVLQRTLKSLPKAHIVVLDVHGEYGWKDASGKQHSAFPDGVARHVDARELEIPYWLLTYAELVDLLIDRSDPNASIQIAFMREVIYNLRRKANLDTGADRISVDSPMYFSIKEMYLQFKRVNEQQLDFGKNKGPLNGAFDEFLVRFQAMFNDSRYDFLFKPKKRSESEDLEGLLRDFIGLGDPKAQITVIDLSATPHDVRPTISSQIGRLAFEFNFWNPQRREFPILLVCEEAHQYIPRSNDPQFAGTRKAMERIAKEGRKYGVGLCVVSQRPLELSETILAQCGNFICLRISNPDDQEYIRRLMPEGEQYLVDTLSSLRRGEALVVGESIPLPTRMQVYKPDPEPASQDVPITQTWRSGPDDLDVERIVKQWWQQKR